MKDSIAYLRAALQTLYPAEEAACITRLTLSSVCGLSYGQQVLHRDLPLGGNEKAAIRAIADRLGSGEPLQYILGETEFYSLTLKVNPSVFIPRHETEELTDIIVRRHGAASPPPAILDVGTGSGCIAVALAKYLPGSAVTAVDISEAALETAAGNARLHNVGVRFIHADILQPEEARRLLPVHYNIIVSNPPYITESEKAAMERNVLDYEPHGALFAPVGDPLRFYRAIAGFAQSRLLPGGYCYFEINPLYAAEMDAMLRGGRFTNVETMRDLSGKNRFVSFQKL